MGHRYQLTSQKKVTKMLLFVSSVFVVLNMPSYVLRAWHFYYVSANTIAAIELEIYNL